MLVIAQDIEDSPERSAFIEFTTEAIRDDHMDTKERRKSMRLYVAMLKTEEPPECMHPLLKKTVGSWMREDWLNTMQKLLDDQPCEI